MYQIQYPFLWIQTTPLLQGFRVQDSKSTEPLCHLPSIPITTRGWKCSTACSTSSQFKPCHPIQAPGCPRPISPANLNPSPPAAHIFKIFAGCHSCEQLLVINMFFAHVEACIDKLKPEPLRRLFLCSAESQLTLP